MLRYLGVVATLLAIGHAGLLVDRGQLRAQLQLQGLGRARADMPDRIGDMSQPELERQKFILDLLQRPQEPLPNGPLLQLSGALVSDDALYDGGLDSEMRFVLRLAAEGRLLRKQEICRISNAQDVRQYLGIYRLLLRASDWPTFQRNAAYLRQHVNAVLFVDAFLLALRERKDTQRLLIPATYEILPELYYDEPLVRQARSLNVQQLASSAATTRRPSLFELIGIGRRNRLMGQALAGIADPLARAQLWQPWREWRLQAAMRQQKGEPLQLDIDNRVVLPVVRNSDDGMALLMDDIGFKAYLQSFIGELTLRQAEARAAEQSVAQPGTQIAAESDIGQAEESSLDSAQLLLGSRRTPAQRRFMENADIGEESPRQRYEDSAEAAASNQQPWRPNSASAVPSDRLLYVGRRRQSQLRGNQAERFLGLMQPEDMPEQAEQMSDAGMNLPTRSRDDPRLLYIGRRRINENSVAPREAPPMRYYEDDNGAEAAELRRYKYDTYDELNRIRDEERATARQRMAAERERAREQRERERRIESGSRYYADNDDDEYEDQPRAAYTTRNDDASRMRAEQRAAAQQARSRNEAERAREQPRNSRNQYYEMEDENESAGRRRVRYDTRRIDSRAEQSNRRESDREQRRRVYAARDGQDAQNKPAIDQEQELLLPAEDRLLVIGRRRRVPRSIDAQQLQFQQRRNAQLLTHNLQQLMARINLQRDVADQAPMAATLQQCCEQLVQRFRVTLEAALRQRRPNDDIDGIIADVLIGRRGQASIIDMLSEYVQQLPSASGMQRLSDAGVIFDQPAVQRTLNGVLRVIDELRSQIDGSYSSAELRAPGIELVSVRADGMRTFLEPFDADLLNVARVNVTQQAQRMLVARQQRLNQKSFKLQYELMAQQPERLVVRTFLGPQLSAADGLPQLDSQRLDFMLLDAAIVNVQPGRNVWTRQSRDISWPARDSSTYTQIYQRVMGALQGDLEQQQRAAAGIEGQSCRFPARLLLPRGRMSGLPLQLFSIVTRLDERAAQYAIDDEAICGIGIASVKLDERSLGYPLDRPIDNIAQLLNLPNVLLSEVSIYHDDSL